MTTYPRPERAVFRFSGPEAQKLLNDVLTGPVAAEPGPARWFALLSPQGKILAEGLCGWADGAFWIDVAQQVAEDFLRRMRLYRLRAQVTIDDLRSTHRVGWSPDGNATGIVQADARGQGLGMRVIAEAAEAETWQQGGDAHAKARIAHGIAELGPDFAPDTTFPHDIGMDHLDGVDFKKGCYIGQEVVSRMQHRGTARRRPVIVSGVLAPSGSALKAGDREAGTLGQVVDGAAVAIARIDRIADAGAMTVGGEKVKIALPSWATYRFGESAGAD